MLIITKVEDPEELDTKFSNFAPGVREEDSELDDMISELSSAAEVLDLFKKIQDSVLPPLPARAGAAELADKEENIIFGGRLGEYKYYDMDAVIASALDMAAKELQ